MTKETIRQVLSTLSPGSSDNTIGLGLQTALQEYAAAEQCSFNPDLAGNICVLRSGRDNGLSEIAITFAATKSSLESSLPVFDALVNEDLACGLTFIGPNPGDIAASSNDQNCAGNEENGSGVNVEPAFSAVFVVRERDVEALRLEGSPLLVSRAMKYAGSLVKLKTAISNNSDTPRLLVEGPMAVSIAIETIREYSRYVAALFENFD